MLHPWKVTCPNCKREATINGLKFSSDGQIHIDLICVLCGINLDYDSSWEKIIINCSHKDGKSLILTEVSKELQCKERPCAYCF